MESFFLDSIKKEFELSETPPGEVASLMLAFIGDAVYEVVTRTIVLGKGNRPINAVHKDNIKLVNATTQARMAEILMEDFTAEEQSQYRRGKNTKSSTSAKNSTLADYKKATGFEAVIGFLYLKGEHQRIIDLCKLGFARLELM